MSEVGPTDPTLERKFRGHKDTVTALHFSPNDDQLVSSCLDSSLMLWQLRGAMRSYRFVGHSESVLDVAYSPSGRLLASASRDRSVRLWLPSVTGSTGEFRAHSQTVRSVQFTSDSAKLLTASDDKTIKLWSVARQKFISSYVGHTNWVRCARLSSDNSVVASCSDDKTLKLWSIDSGECIHTYTEQKGSGQQLAWHPSGCYVAVGLSNGTVKLYDTRTHALLQHYRIHDGAVAQISFHPSGSYLLTCSRDNKMKILDLLEGHPVYTLTGHSGAITAITFSLNGDYFASGGDDKQVLIWKTNFTELKDDSTKENAANNISPPSGRKTHGFKLNKDNKGVNIWNQCYHNTKVPIGSYVQLNTIQEGEESFPSPVPSCSRSGIHKRDSNCTDTEVPFYNVGDLSHIPRRPPSPRPLNLPQLGTLDSSLMGMISLKDDEVCYTNGTIEWVGRKRTMIGGSDSRSPSPEPVVKRHRPSRRGVMDESQIDKIVDMESCSCGDMMPTIGTIVEHLSALHDAVEIVDERLIAVEGHLENDIGAS